MAKRPKTQRHEPSKPATSSFRALQKGIPEMLSRNFEGILFTLAVLHILIFLVFLGSIATFRSGGAGRPRAFGEPVATSRRAVVEPAKPDRPITKPGAFAFAAYTVLFWGLLLVKRRSASPRVFRFICIMLLPGTIMAAYGVFQALQT